MSRVTITVWEESKYPDRTEEHRAEVTVDEVDLDIGVKVLVADPVVYVMHPDKSARPELLVEN